MRLILPYRDQLDAGDSRLQRLAEFCGVPCEPLRLESSLEALVGALEHGVTGDDVAFVVNGRALRRWSSSGSFPEELGSYLVSRFPVVFVHNLEADSFGTGVLRCLSGDRLKALRPATGEESGYEVEAAPGSACGAFGGCRFGPINSACDRVFEGDGVDAGVRGLVQIDGRPLLATVQHGRARVFLLASKEIADLQAPEPDFNVARYFSRLVPPAMFLRQAFAGQCWQPHSNNATLIIDDPLLTSRYGYLRYDRVLELMDRHEFHTSIAFIPYNRLRTSSRIGRMFVERPDRYSLCVHGNNHTAGEMAVTDLPRLNSLLETATGRMNEHRRLTGIPYDRVMVFPQGAFSGPAMRALKAHNFLAAVNSGPHPRAAGVEMSVGDYLTPAITTYSGFPLYLRKYVCEIAPHDVAFNLFFGKPVLLVEHHRIFSEVDRLLDAVARVNTVGSLRWSNLRTAIESSFMQRELGDGTLEIQTYAGWGRLDGKSSSALRCAVTKNEGRDIPVAEVLVNQEPIREFAWRGDSIRFSFEVSNGADGFAVRYANDLPRAAVRPGAGETVRIALRRRASEFRDNCLSKHPALLSAAEAVVRPLLDRRGDRGVVVRGFDTREH